MWEWWEHKAQTKAWWKNTCMLGRIAHISLTYVTAISNIVELLPCLSVHLFSHNIHSFNNPQPFLIFCPSHWWKNIWLAWKQTQMLKLEVLHHRGASICFHFFGKLFKLEGNISLENNKQHEMPRKLGHFFVFSGSSVNC